MRSLATMVLLFLRRSRGILSSSGSRRLGRVLGAQPPKRGFHVRNRHPGRYDFARLTEFYPPLGELMYTNPVTELPTLDWSLRESVMAINSAILTADYGVVGLAECLPDGYLVPPIPSRAEYVHIIGDLLTLGDEPPRGEGVLGVDVGTGAFAIYAHLGSAEYGWGFVASDVDETALKSARRSVEMNTANIAVVESSGGIFEPPLREACLQRPVAFTMCNPPFHESAEQAARMNDRKRKGLAKNKEKKYGLKDYPVKDAMNYGGMSHELWCDGGELKFVGDKMMRESRAWSDEQPQNAPIWFTSLVSKGSRIDPLKKMAEDHGATQVRVVEFATSQKVSRIIAWSFLDDQQRERRLRELYDTASSFQDI